MAIIQIDVEVKEQYWQAGALLHEVDLGEISKRVATMLSHMAYDIKDGKGVPPPTVFKVTARRYRW